MKIAHIHMMWIWKQQGENLELVLKAGGQRKVNTQTASPGWGETSAKNCRAVSEIKAQGQFQDHKPSENFLRTPRLELPSVLLHVFRLLCNI